VTEARENVMDVSGRLTIETTAALFGSGLVLKDGCTEMEVDLARVEAVDSTAVSLMLSWLRAAQARNIKLRFVNVPENLVSLANLYGVAESLSLRVDA
jgi:phospholipid transport system transporter-binding protein